jgi:hypothetical protein
LRSRRDSPERKLEVISLPLVDFAEVTVYEWLTMIGFGLGLFDGAEFSMETEAQIAERGRDMATSERASVPISMGLKYMTMAKMARRTVSYRLKVVR